MSIKLMDALSKFWSVNPDNYEIPYRREKPTVRLVRVYEDAKGFGTFGCFVTTAGKTICKTAELNWRDNKRNVSCIPPGVYDAASYVSPTFGSCFLLSGIPDRDSVLVHYGNWAGLKGESGVLSDTEGCILVGISVREIREPHSGIKQLGVTNSRSTIEKLVRLYPGGFTLLVEAV